MQAQLMQTEAYGLFAFLFNTSASHDFYKINFESIKL